ALTRIVLRSLDGGNLVTLKLAEVNEPAAARDHGDSHVPSILLCLRLSSLGRLFRLIELDARTTVCSGRRSCRRLLRRSSVRKAKHHTCDHGRENAITHEPSSQKLVARTGLDGPVAVPA